MQRTARDRSVTRTIRYSERLDDILRRDASNNGVNVNSLVNSILTKYALWDRYTEKLEFVTLTGETFRQVLEDCDEQKLKEIARRTARSDVTDFMFDNATPDDFLQRFSFYARYAGIGKVMTESDGINHSFNLHHHLGNKWALYMKYFFSETITKAYGVLPDIETGDVSLRVRFTVDRKESGKPKNHTSTSSDVLAKAYPLLEKSKEKQAFGTTIAKSD